MTPLWYWKWFRFPSKVGQVDKLDNKNHQGRGNIEATYRSFLTITREQNVLENREKCNRPTFTNTRNFVTKVKIFVFTKNKLFCESSRTRACTRVGLMAQDYGTHHIEECPCPCRYCNVGNVGNVGITVNKDRRRRSSFWMGSVKWWGPCSLR